MFLAEEAASSCTGTLTSHSSSEQDVPLKDVPKGSKHHSKMTELEQRRSKDQQRRWHEILVFLFTLPLNNLMKNRFKFIQSFNYLHSNQTLSIKVVLVFEWLGLSRWFLYWLVTWCINMTSITFGDTIDCPLCLHKNDCPMAPSPTSHILFSDLLIICKV